MFITMIKAGIVLLGVVVAFWVGIKDELDGKMIKKMLIALAIGMALLAGVDLLPGLPGSGIALPGPTK